MAGGSLPLTRSAPTRPTPERAGSVRAQGRGSRPRATSRRERRRSRVSPRGHRVPTCHRGAAPSLRCRASPGGVPRTVSSALLRAHRGDAPAVWYVANARAVAVVRQLLGVPETGTPDGRSAMRLVLALTAAGLLASPSDPAGARDTCHGPSCTHGVPGSGPGGSPGAGHQGGTPGNGHGPGSRGPAACEAARCMVQSAVDESCPCDAAANHGSYLKCVARALGQLAAQAAVPHPCVGRIMRCAARSTCGKPGAVTCQTAESTCDAPNGTCTNAPSVSCTADSDCGTECSIASSADSCQTAGGTVGTGTTCCAVCTTTTTSATTTTTTTMMP